MLRRDYIIFLLAVVSRYAAAQAPALWSGDSAAPVQIWSINAEVDMDLQTADVRVQGPGDVLAVRTARPYKTHLDDDQEQGKTHLSDAQMPPEPLREDKVTAQSPRETAPSPAAPAKSRMVVAVKAACCDACEAPYAVQLLHALAHGLGMVVVVFMWLVLTAAILVLFF